MMTPTYQPLAARLRPTSIGEYVGQQHLLALGKPLRQALDHQALHSMILWGPPGTGKTSLAVMIAQQSGAHFLQLSAVLSGVKDIREAVVTAQEIKQTKNQKTVLFVDEVHRFNKSQQDAFLPYVENGTFIFIGATTENPSFELNNPLLSRARVYVLKSLSEEDLLQVLERALTDVDRGLGSLNIDFPLELRKQLVQVADGDARRLLNLLEILSDFSTVGEALVVTPELLAGVINDSVRRFDKQGEAFYDQISALHKSVRGSDPDAALYWLARMIDGGCDPLYIARRVVRMASEDIGNADPRALTLALNAWDTQERLGSPEGPLTIAQAVVYMACAAKSNAVYVAWNRVVEDVKRFGSLEIPLHLRNAPTKLMKDLGYGHAYRYAHDEPNAYAAGERYFPEGMPERKYYEPVDRGMEIQIKEKLKQLAELDGIESLRGTE